MKVYTTAPLEDLRRVPEDYSYLERVGYDGAFSFEAKHDPFVPIAVASQHTRRMRLGTAVAIAFARNPMTLANLGYDLQVVTRGRFALGLGTQVRPHIEKRFSSVWSRPVARMREMVAAIRAIWNAWQTGAKLDFRGDFYTHTIMIPAFDPGPNPYGPPPILLGGFQPKMVALAGEVADGYIAHPFNSRRSLLERTLPALEKGLARAGRRRKDIEVICPVMVVTGDDEAEFLRVREVARKHLAFYGSTPAYAGTLECHGWGDLHRELNALSKQGRWNEMAALISDEILETLAVVGPRDQIAPMIRERFDGIADAVSLTNNRAPDPRHWADVVAALKAA